MQIMALIFNLKDVIITSPKNFIIIISFSISLKGKTKMENLTHIYFNYANGTYSTENEYIGNNDNIDFEQALTIQRQELMELAENELLTWKQAFELEGDFVAWNELIDDFQGYGKLL